MTFPQENPNAITETEAKFAKFALRMRIARERAPQVVARRDGWRGCVRGWLENEYKRAHRVSDTRELQKPQLIWQLLVDEFGADAVHLALNTKPAVEFDTHEYLCNHGAQPRGYGGWAFEIEGRPELLWVNQHTFADAKKVARADAQDVGRVFGASHMIVKVCT